MFLTPAQQIIFAALNGNLTGCQVFDTAPFLPEAAPANAFPYVVIGDDTQAPWDTDDTLGADMTITLHFWSRAAGMKQVKALMDEAYGLLNRGSWSLSGVRVVDCLHEFSDVMTDPDGKTRHGVQRYRLTLQEA